MSYARLGNNSDVYVFLGGDGLFRCTWCSLKKGDASAACEWVGVAHQMRRHLEEHLRAGDMVPDGVFREIRQDAPRAWLTRMRMRQFSFMRARGGA